MDLTIDCKSVSVEVSPVENWRVRVSLSEIDERDISQYDVRGELLACMDVEDVIEDLGGIERLCELRKDEVLDWAREKLEITP